MVIALPMEHVSSHQGEGDNTDRPGALIDRRNQQFNAPDFSELPSDFISIPQSVSLKNHTSSFACLSPFTRLHIYSTLQKIILQNILLCFRNVNVFSPPFQASISCHSFLYWKIISRLFLSCAFSITGSITSAFVLVATQASFKSLLIGQQAVQKWI